MDIYIILFGIVLAVMLSSILSCILFPKLKKYLTLSIVTSLLLMFLLIQSTRIFLIKESNKINIEILIQEGVCYKWDSIVVIRDSTDNYLDRLFPDLVKALEDRDNGHK